MKALLCVLSLGIASVASAVTIDSSGNFENLRVPKKWTSHIDYCYRAVVTMRECCFPGLVMDSGNRNGPIYRWLPDRDPFRPRAVYCRKSSAL